MPGAIIGAIGGIIIVWILLLAKSNGPMIFPSGKYIPGTGPGCFVSLAAYIFGAAIGAAIGATVVTIFEIAK